MGCSYLMRISIYYEYVLAIQMPNIPQATFTNKCLHKFSNNWNKNQWFPYFDLRTSTALLWSGVNFLTYHQKTKHKWFQQYGFKNLYLVTVERAEVSDSIQQADAVILKGAVVQYKISLEHSKARVCTNIFTKLNYSKKKKQNQKQINQEHFKY